MAELTLDCAYPDLFTPAEGQLLSEIQEPRETWEPGQRLTHAAVPLSAPIYLTEAFWAIFVWKVEGGGSFWACKSPVIISICPLICWDI